MTFMWMMDLYGWAIQADAITEDGGIRGILLIDEVEQHLHPSMQTGLLEELRRALPEMQLFATTHSALAALGAGSEQVIALHRKGRSVRVASTPSFAGYSAEDVLIEESLFGVDPYPRSTRRKLDRHQRLASTPRSRRSEEQTKEMAALATELDPARLPRLRDDPVAQKLDELAELLKQETGS